MNIFERLRAGCVYPHVAVLPICLWFLVCLVLGFKRRPPTEMGGAFFVIKWRHNPGVPGSPGRHLPAKAALIRKTGGEKTKD